MTTFTEKVEKILDDAFEMGKGLHPEDYPTLKASMLKKAEEAHQAEISRVLELWEDDIERGFIPKCSYCATKRKVVGQTVKGKDAQKNNNLPRNWGYYCQKCYDEGSELEREAMYG